MINFPSLQSHLIRKWLSKLFHVYHGSTYRRPQESNRLHLHAWRHTRDCFASTDERHSAKSDVMAKSRGWTRPMKLAWPVITAVMLKSLVEKQQDAGNKSSTFRPVKNMSSAGSWMILYLLFLLRGSLSWNVRWWFCLSSLPASHNKQTPFYKDARAVHASEKFRKCIDRKCNFFHHDPERLSFMSTAWNEKVQWWSESMIPFVICIIVYSF